MGLIAKIIVSAEQFALNPVNWFDRQPWLIRMLSVLLVIPFISVISIFLFVQFTAKSEAVTQQFLQEQTGQLIAANAKLQADQTKSITELQTQVRELKTLITSPTSLESEPSSMSAASPTVLGTSQTAEPTVSGLQNTVYLPLQTDLIKIYEQPVITSDVVEEITSDSLHLFLQKKSNWYQIKLEGNKAGWIPAELVIELP